MSYGDPFTFAIKLGDYDRVKRMLDSGVDPNLYDDFYNNANTGLMKAAHHGYTDIAELLLENGANLETKDSMGMTALSYGVSAKRYDIVEFLLNVGANPNNINKGGYTPLASALLHGNEKISRLLIERGANLNNKDNKGNTPLMYTNDGEIDIVELLLENGADPTLQNNDGKSAYELALDNGHIEKARLIREYMDLQRSQQNLAFATSMMPQSNNTPLRYLDHDTLGEIMSRSRPYDPSVKIRMLEEYDKDPLTKSKQRLATMKGIRDNDSMLQYLREPKLMENVNKYLSSMRPQPSVQSRMMLEDKQKTKKISVSSEKDKIVIGSNVEFMIKGERIVGVVEKETPKKYKICCKPGKVSGEKGSIYMVNKSDVQLFKKGGKLSSKNRSKKNGKTKKKNRS